MKKILFIKGNSQYGTLRVYADIRINELRRQGYSVQVLDRTIQGQWENLPSLIEDGVEIVMSSQLVALKAMIRLRDKPQYKNLCYVCTLGDHPAMEDYWFKQVLAEEKFYLCTKGVNDIKYLNKYYPNVRTIRGRNLFGAWGLIDKIKDYDAREYDVYFGGSSFNIEQCIYKIENELNKEDQTIAKSIVKMFLEERFPLDIPIEDVLSIYLDMNNIILDDLSFRELRARLQVLEFFARGYYRYKCIEVLIHAGIQVYVYGYGWECSPLIKNENFILIDDTKPSLEKGMQYMNNSKIVLNVTRNDLHDRLTNTMLAGALCCTSASNVTREFFSEDEAVMFGADDIKRLPEIVRYYLDRPELSKQIAQNGYKKIIEQSSVTRTVSEFIEGCRNAGIEI